MATLSQLAESNLALKGAGTDYNYINRFFATKAEADAALADSSWTPVAGKLNACLTGDQGFFVYNAGTSSLDLADAATRAYIDTQIGNLVDSSPATLDTLNELAAAINDDPAYFTTAEAARVANTNLINAETSRATAAEAAVQADVDQNEADADAAIAAVQADVDQNEADADAAIAAVQADVDQNETDADAAIAAVQADVDQNETDADAAIAAVQADVDANEVTAANLVTAQNTAMLAAVAVVQADVDQNETDADAAIAAVQTDVNQNEAAALAARNTIQADVDANEAASIASLALKAPLASPALTGTPTSPTASQGAGTTQIATTAYVDTAIAGLVDSAPGAINTLNELAAALGDDANFSTTITAAVTAVQNDVNQNEVDADAAIAAVQADVNQNEADADAAIAALQADVDQNEADADAASTALGNRIATLESDPTTATALAAVQADVDQNEADADAAIATKLNLSGGTLTGSLVVNRDFPDLQLKSNQEKRLLFTDAGGGATGAIKNVSSAMTFFAGGVAGSNLEMTVASDGVDVSALKIDGTAVTATAAELNFVDGVTSNVQTQLDAIQADVDGNESDADTALATKAPLASPSLTGTPTAPTAAAGTNTTQVATTAYVQGEVTNLIDGAPNALNTLNELAAALNDDTSAATNLTTLINANETHIDNVATLLGIAKDGQNFGTFSGGTINDNLTLKSILQALETKAEAIQTDVDGNESDADAAIAAVQADVDQNESDADAAIAALQADVDQNEADADAAIALKAALTGAIFSGDVTLKKSDGSAVALKLSRTDHADMNTEFKIQPSYVNINKECLNIMAGSDVIVAFDERQRVAINTTDPDYTLDVGGDGKFSTNLIVGGTLTLGSTAITSTAAELNILDGVTSTAAELNILDGVTATATELNLLDGVTATTAELNYVDGVTSSIQTQLNSIQADVDQNESDADTAIGAKLDASAVSTFGGTLVDDADAAAARTTLGLGTAATTAASAYATAAQGATADAALPASGAQAALHVDHIITLSGVAQASDNLGTFTGSTISDNGTIKAGMQELETAVETKLSAETITLTAFKAVVAASSDFGDFQTRVAAL